MRRIPSISLEQLGLDVVKLGVPSVYSVWVGVESDALWAGDPPEWNDPVDVLITSCLQGRTVLVVSQVAAELTAKLSALWSFG